MKRLFSPGLIYQSFVGVGKQHGPGFVSLFTHAAQSCRKEGFLDSSMNFSLSTNADIQLSMGGIMCTYFLSRYFCCLEFLWLPFATLVSQFVSAEVVETLPTALDKTWIMVLILRRAWGGSVHPHMSAAFSPSRCPNTVRHLASFQPS